MFYPITETAAAGNLTLANCHLYMINKKNYNTSLWHTIVTSHVSAPTLTMRHYVSVL